MKAIIFDVDGTLVDSSASLVEAQRRTFERFDLPFPGRERALSVVGLSLREAFETLIGADGPAVEMAAYYRTLFAEMRADPAYQERLFPGADEALRLLAARDDVVLGVATGKSRRGVAAMVERQGWHGLFSAVQTADDAPSKPHPAMLQQAIAELGCDADRAVMVGDSSYDIDMATAAGVASIAVSWGFQPVQGLLARGASASIDHFFELPDVALRLLSERAPAASSAVSPAADPRYRPA